MPGTMDLPASPANKIELLRRIARMVPGAMTLGRWLHRLIDPDLRAIHRLMQRERGRLFQPFPDTFEERYPALFDALAARLQPLTSPRILSFGCSSGAEVRALRRRLPAARITGIDLNPRELAKAARADRNPLSHYSCAAAPEPGTSYAAILALAVFRHGALEAEQPDECSAILPFARFEAGIAALDACLEPGGLLAIHHSHFRFTDTSAACRYDAVELLLPEVEPPTILFGADNCRIMVPGLLPVLFRKQA